jgi:hypothetical protein
MLRCVVHANLTAISLLTMKTLVFLWTTNLYTGGGALQSSRHILRLLASTRAVMQRPITANSCACTATHQQLSSLHLSSRLADIVVIPWTENGFLRFFDPGMSWLRNHDRTSSFSTALFSAISSSDLIFHDSLPPRLTFCLSTSLQYFAFSTFVSHLTHAFPVSKERQSTGNWSVWGVPRLIFTDTEGTGTGKGALCKTCPRQLHLPFVRKSGYCNHIAVVNLPGRKAVFTF